MVSMPNITGLRCCDAALLSGPGSSPAGPEERGGEGREGDSETMGGEARGGEGRDGGEGVQVERKGDMGAERRG